MKIVIATDGTERSKGTIEAVVRLRPEPGSEISLVTVVDMGLGVTLGSTPEESVSANVAEERAQKHASEALGDAEASLRAALGAEIRIVRACLSGTPARRIVEFAEEQAADLIIVGSHGYNRWERLLLGSVSDSIVHHAPCSVLVVRS